MNIRKIACLLLLFTQFNPAFHCLSAVTVGEIEKSQQDIDKELSLRKKLEQGERYFITKIIIKGAFLIPEERIKEITQPYESHWLIQDDIQLIMNLIEEEYRKFGFSARISGISYKIERDSLTFEINELTN